MTKIQLEELLNVKGNHEDINYITTKNVENLFIKSLQIEEIINGLFSFALEETKGLALRVIRDLCTDKERIKQRQEYLEYLINHKDYVTLKQRFKESLYLSKIIDAEDVYAPNPNRDYHSLEINTGKLVDYFNYLKSFLNSLKTLGDLLADSPFDQISYLINKTLNLESYNSLTKEFERIDELGDKTNREKENMAWEIRHIKSRHGTLLTTLDYMFGFAQGFRNLKEVGANVIFPEIVSGKYKICQIQQGVNPLLYLGSNHPKQKIPNNFDCDELQPVVLITGENMYGKTMAVKTRAILQAFFQASLPILAEGAKLSTRSKILTNIALTEDSLRGKSTYNNINDTTMDLFRAATPGSLLILDEPTSGTYELKALAQLKIYLRVSADVGLQTWVVTHHLKATELAKDYMQILNLTTEVIDGKETYKLIPGIFQPQEDNVKVDYSYEKVLQAARTPPLTSKSRMRKQIQYGHGLFPLHLQRLNSLFEEKLMPNERIEAYETLYRRAISKL